MVTVNYIRGLYRRDADIAEINNAFSEVDINNRDGDNHECSPLHLAAAYVNLYAIRLLLDKGAVVNAKDDEGRTPIFYLVSPHICYKEQDMVSATVILLEYGANISRSARNTNVLFAAISNNNLPMVEVLIKSGQKIGFTNNYGENALHLLSRKVGETVGSISRLEKIMVGFEEWNPEKIKKQTYEELEVEYVRKERWLSIVRFLLESGQIDVDAKTSYGKTAFDLAVEWRAKCVSSILSGVDGYIGRATGGMDIFQSILMKDKEAVEALIACGLDLQTECSHKEMTAFYGKSPLACALEWSFFDAAIMMLDTGADPGYKFGEGNTAFSAWIDYCRDTDGKERYSSVLDCMKQHGWNLNAAVDKEGNTALAFACRHIHKELAMTSAIYIINNGANLNKANICGQTPMMVLYGARFYDGRSLYSSPYSMVGGKDEIEFLELLLEAGACSMCKDNWGNTIMHYIVNDCYDAEAVKAAELLMDFGFDGINFVNNSGQTALEIAAAKGTDSLVKFLLKYS